MDSAVYWRSALGLFWAFMFFMLLSLVVGMTFLSRLAFYPYAIFLSTILLFFLTAFLLFEKRIKAGLYMCLALSLLFIINQAFTLYFLFAQPAGILPLEIFTWITKDQASVFPFIVSAFLLLWGIFLFAATWKSRPVFQKEARQEQLNWLVKLKKQAKAEAKSQATAKNQQKPAARPLPTPKPTPTSKPKKPLQKPLQ